MLLGFSTHIFLCKPKINYKNPVKLTTHSHKEIVGLDITMEVAFRVQELYARYHLISQHKYSFCGEVFRTIQK